MLEPGCETQFVYDINFFEIYILEYFTFISHPLALSMICAPHFFLNS